MEIKQEKTKALKKDTVFREDTNVKISPFMTKTESEEYFIYLDTTSPSWMDVSKAAQNHTTFHVG